MLSPLPRRSDWRYCLAHPSSRISLPRNGCRVGLRIVLFEICSAFTRVTACTLALSPIRDSLTRRLQPLRYLHSCSGCFRLERLPGGAFTHWKAPPLHGARHVETFILTAPSTLERLLRPRTPPYPPIANRRFPGRVDGPTADSGYETPRRPSSSVGLPLDGSMPPLNASQA